VLTLPTTASWHLLLTPQLPDSKHQSFNVIGSLVAGLRQGMLASATASHQPQVDSWHAHCRQHGQQCIATAHCTAVVRTISGIPCSYTGDTAATASGTLPA